MKRNHLTPSLLLSILAALALALAFAPSAHAQAETLEDRTRQIAKQLQCPVCESVSVADSPADLAVQMRSVIRARLEAGESEPQIIQYFVERYGDQVLVEPPRRGLALAVWWAPVAILLGGAGLLFAVLRSWQRGVAVSRNGTEAAAGAAIPTLQPPTFEQIARDELERYRREVGG